MAAASFDADVARHDGAAAGTGRALGVHAASRKIGKHGQPERKPVIIYMVSPKIIHVEAHEFMPLVQRLTGPGAGRGAGDKKSRPSTSAGEEEKEEAEGGAGSKARAAAPPVRVKARALNRPAGGPAVSVSVTATRQQHQTAAGAAAAATPASGFMFHDLSPLRGAALKAEHLPLVSPGWLHHVGDHFLSPGGGAAAALGSPSAAGFLDIFGPLFSHQQ